MSTPTLYSTKPLTDWTPQETPKQGHTVGVPTDRLLTQRDVSDIFRVTLRTVQRWSSEGLLPVIRVGGTTRYHPDHISEVIQGSTEMVR